MFTPFVLRKGASGVNLLGGVGRIRDIRVLLRGLFLAQFHRASWNSEKVFARGGNIKGEGIKRGSSKGYFLFELIRGRTIGHRPRTFLKRGEKSEIEKENSRRLKGKNIDRRTLYV